MCPERDWFEDDDLWEVVEPLIFNEKVLEKTPADVDGIVALLRLEPGARVLDLGCGPGRISLELARRGYRVTGVDRTARYLEKAGKAAAADGLDIELVLEDMRRFSRPGAFDAALSLFTTLGYFDDPAENQGVLDGLNESLVEGGGVVVELVGKEVLARIFRERDWQWNGDVIVPEERKVAGDWARMENRWIILDGAERREIEFSHFAYSATELSGMLTAAGFRDVRCFGGLDGSPYDHQARRLACVGRK